MVSTKEALSSLYACKGPPILMGEYSLVEITDKGRIKLNHGSFEDVLHVPKISVNILSIYQITHYGTRKRVEFTLDAVNIFDIQINSKVATSEVNHKSRLYTFSEFIEPDSSLLLRHGDDISRLCMKDLVILILDTCNNSTSTEWSLAFPTFIFPNDFFKDVLLENILKRSLKKGRVRGPPLPWISSIVI